MGVAAPPSGLRPFGVEPPVASQAEPLVPNANRCDWCVGFIRRDCTMFRRCVKRATDRSYP